jgi:hypothetical protein
MTEAIDRCSNCGGSTVAGEISFAKEMRRAGDAWVPVGGVEAYPVCQACYTWVERLMVMVITPGPSPMPMGTPSAGNTRGPALDDRSCDYCDVWLMSPSYTVSLLPFQREIIRRSFKGPSLVRHVGHIRSNRICSECYLWWRATLDDNSAMRGTSFRSAEGAIGGWLGDVAYDAYSLYLEERDEQILGTTVETMGRGYGPIQANDLRRVTNPAQVVFISGNHDRRASDLLATRPKELLRSSVVVARTDGAEDAALAMRAGAGDFLISPLSPQQVSGAFDRISDATWGQKRHEATGLPIVEKPSARHGLSCHKIRADISKDFDVWTACILMRRAIRGYDRIGVDAAGKPALLIYCPTEHLERALERLSRVMDGMIRFTELETDEAAPEMAAAAA